MRDDPEYNIAFCELIEEFPCLYDTTISTLNKREDQNQAWAKIGEHLKERDSDCRQRWRNIRCGYIKSRKKENELSLNGKRYKEYYLTPYLHFLEPFVRKNENETLISPSNEDTENSTDEEEDRNIEHNDESGSGMCQSPSPLCKGNSKETSSAPHAKHNGYEMKILPTVETNVNEPLFIEFKNTQEHTEETITTHTEESIDPDMAFLQSLLPDMKSMNAGTKRMFKLNVLQLADQLLNP